MKNRVWVGLLLLITVWFLNTTAEAKSYESVNGVACWQGNLNFPYWTAGNHSGAIWDVSSACLQNIDDDKIEITILSYSVTYEDNDRPETVSASEVLCLHENRSDGSVYYARPFSKWQNASKSDLDYRAYFNPAYYLVKHQLGLS